MYIMKEFKGLKSHRLRVLLETGVLIGLQPTFRKSSCLAPGRDWEGPASDRTGVALIPNPRPPFVRPSKFRAAGLSMSVCATRRGVDAGGGISPTPFRLRGVLEGVERRAALSRNDFEARTPKRRPKSSRLDSSGTLNGEGAEEEGSRSSPLWITRGVPRRLPHVINSFMASGPICDGDGLGRAETNPNPCTLGVSSPFLW